MGMTAGCFNAQATFVVLTAALLLSVAGAVSAETIRATPANLQQALDAAKPGDTVLLADGLYKGGLHMKRSGSDGAPIVIKAEGSGAVVDGGKDGLSLDGVSWVTVEGIRFQNAAVAGVYVRRAQPSSGPNASHVVLRNLVCANNTKWGIITSHIDHFTVEACETFGATIEHGIYFANASVAPVIRNNVVHHNAGNGIHINGDPDCGGTGIITNALVEGNVIFENGAKGGSAMSVMHVQDSLFRNNLLYHNYAHGFTLFWYTGDEATQSSKRNRIYNNTVFFRPGEGRFSLLMRRSSTDCIVKNNIFVGGARGAMFVEPSCLSGLVIDNNVIFNYDGQRLFGDALEEIEVDAAGGDERLGEWKEQGFAPDISDGVEIPFDQWLAKGFDTKSILGKLPAFVDAAAGDFHLVSGSVGIDAGVDLSDDVAVDIAGNARPQGGGFDCGCYELEVSEGK